MNLVRGKVVWQKKVTRPFSVQRLPNGNTFIVAVNVIFEVDRAGKLVLSVSAPGQGFAARRLKDGRGVDFDRSNVVQLDKTGREVKRIPVMVGGAGCNEVLDNGHVLALSPGMGNITEFDENGKVVGSFDLPGASHGFRLSNGHTLVTVEQNKFVELDKNWKPVKETPLTAPAWVRARALADHPSGRPTATSRDGKKSSFLAAPSTSFSRLEK